FDRQRTLVEWLRLCVPTLALLQAGEAIHAPGHIEMIRPVDLFAHCQCSLVERLRLRVPPLELVKVPEVLQAQGDIGMIRPEGLLGRLQCPLCRYHGLLVAALPIQQLDLAAQSLPLGALCVSGDTRTDSK